MQVHSGRQPILEGMESSSTSNNAKKTNYLSSESTTYLVDQVYWEAICITSYTNIKHDLPELSLLGAPAFWFQPGK
jgi:hypothetical protein